MAQRIHSFNLNNSGNNNINSGNVNSIINGSVYTEYNGHTIHQSTSGPGYYYNHAGFPTAYYASQARYGTMGPGSRTHVQIPSVFTATTSNVPTRANVSIGPDWNSSNLCPSIVTYNNGPTSIIAVEESEPHGPTGNNIDKPAVDNIKNKSSVRKVWRFICRLPRLFSCDSSSKKPKLSEKGKASESEKNQPRASAPPQPRSQGAHNVVPEQQQLDSSGPSPPEYRETDNIVSLRHANRGPIRFIIDAHGSIFDNGVSSPQTSQRTNGNSDEISSRQQEVNEIVRDAMRRAAEATAIAQTSFDDAHRLRREILARVQASSPR